MTISNTELLARCNQDSMETIIKQRRWRWIGHVCRREKDNIIRTALHWTPEGKRRRGRPKNTWRRTVEEEMKTLHHSWGTIQKKAQSRQEWKTFVAALRARRHSWHEWVSEVRECSFELESSKAYLSILLFDVFESLQWSKPNVCFDTNNFKSQVKIVVWVMCKKLERVHPQLVPGRNALGHLIVWICSSALLKTQINKLNNRRFYWKIKTYRQTMPRM